MNQHHPYPSSVMMRGIIRRLLTQAKICLTLPNLPKGRLTYFLKLSTPLLIGIFIGWCCFLCSGTFLLYLIRCLFIVSAYYSKFYLSFFLSQHPLTPLSLEGAVQERLLTEPKSLHPHLTSPIFFLLHLWRSLYFGERNLFLITCLFSDFLSLLTK